MTNYNRPYSNSFVRDVIEDTRIEDVVSEDVNLVRKGVNLLGLCPFHNEKTPSFVVSPAKGIYKCFGCGKAGGAVSYEMEKRKLTFREAIAYLAEKQNKEIPVYDKDAEGRYQHLLKMLSDTTNFYHNRVDRVTDYLKNKRKINDHSIEKFKIGYAPDNWNDLQNFLSSQGYSIDEMKSQGLIILRQNAPQDSQRLDDYHARFNHNIIFPVFSIDHKVIGFGARRHPDNDGKDMAKYTNSPTSNIFEKRKILYGINFIVNRVKDTGKLTISEGNIDVIMAQQNEIDCVGTLGTALTTQHLRMLRRYVNEITMLYDDDPAGITNQKKFFIDILNIDSTLVDNDSRAAKKKRVDTLYADMIPKAIILPQGKDPAEFLETHTKLDFEAIPKLGIAEFYFKKSENDLKNMDYKERVKLLEHVVDEMSAIDNFSERIVLLEQISEFFNIPRIAAARIYTKRLTDQITKYSEGDIFSKKIIRNNSALYIASLLRTQPDQALTALRSAPANEIPDDNSIMSKNMLKLYREIDARFNVGDYSFSFYYFEQEQTDAQKQEIAQEHQLIKKTKELKKQIQRGEMLNLLDDDQTTQRKKPRDPLELVKKLVKENHPEYQHELIYALNKLSKDNPLHSIKYLTESVRLGIFLAKEKREQKFDKIASAIAVNDNALLEDLIRDLEYEHARI